MKTRKNVQDCSIDNRSGPPRLDKRASPSIIISKVISTSRNSDLGYCILSEERNPVRKTPQTILVCCRFALHPPPRVGC